MDLFNSESLKSGNTLSFFYHEHEGHGEKNSLVDYGNNMIELHTILKKSDIFRATLSFLNDSDLPNWFICAGFIQQSYFNFRHGYDLHNSINDIDIVFFDPARNEKYDKDTEKNIEKILDGSSIKPDVKNQAHVHLWYKQMFGYSIKPYIDIFSAIDTFPTTTTAIGVRGNLENLSIYTTFGLSDLKNLILRPNKLQITKEIYDKKKEKIAKNWPKVKIIDWA